MLSDAVADREILGRWFARHRAMWPGDRRDVGGSYLAWALSRLITRGVVFGLCTARCSWTLDPHDVAVFEAHEPRGVEGDTLVGVAFAGQLIVPAAGPSSAPGDAIVVLDDAGVVERSAAELVVALDPVFRAVRSVANFGMTGMWGAVVDEVSATAVLAADVVGLAPAVEVADSLVAALRRHTSHIRLLPVIEMVEWNGGVTPVSIKGTCCMRYKTYDHPDRAGEGFCETCPKRDRTALLARHRDRFEARRAG